MQIQVSLPLPPRECYPNFHGHWSHRHRAMQQYLAWCAGAYREARIGKFTNFPITLDLDFYLCRETALGQYLPRDSDNARAGFKAGQDALTCRPGGIGAIPDDSSKYVEMGHTRLHTRKPDHQNKACVVVTITYKGEEDNGKTSKPVSHTTDDTTSSNRRGSSRGRAKTEPVPVPHTDLCA